MREEAEPSFMPEMCEIGLGSTGRNNYSSEDWFLVFPPESSGPMLEGRFQSDAPDRTGFPTWVDSEQCVFRDSANATLRLPLTPLPKPGDRNRFSCISDDVWDRLVKECAKLG
jgi:hypothetical protein